MKNLEIERKFKVRYLPNLEGCERKVITQAYLPTPENDDAEYRIRSIVSESGEEHFFHTTKRGNGLEREETETEISREEFYSLLETHIGNIITKTRYLYPLKNDISYESRPTDLVAEIDVYSGALAGLRVVEVEFKSKEDAKNFFFPAWIDEDITTDSRYKNKSLASLNSTSTDGFKV